MRHHKNKRSLGRERNQRNALLRNLATSLILRGRIETSEAKAKEVRPYVERLVTRAKTGTLANRRFLIGQVGEKQAGKLMEKIALQYKNRKGGYTRIIKTVRRLKDGSFRAYIELV
ncbi:MAG TPA: 50S ribosomal protein L17 [Candidatus Paceibacterota bacterium]